MTAETARRLSVLAVAAVAALALAAPSAVRAAGPALLALAAAAGLPHGAADVALVPGRGRRRLLLLGGYGVAAAVAVAVSLAVPGPALVVLLALSVAHFAEGEVAAQRGSRGAGWTAAAVALAVVAGPLARWPEEVSAVLRPLTPSLAGSVAAPATRGLLAAGVLALAALALVRGDRPGRLDVVVVLAAVVVVPPLPLFAVWFAAWHSPRHLVRVAAQRPLGPLLRRTVLPSLAAAAGAVLLVPLVGSAAAVLLVLLALTVPHAVVVATALGPGEGPGAQSGRSSPTGSATTAIARSNQAPASVTPPTRWPNSS